MGITESGTLLSGNIKSAVGLGIILHQGIGDTIRVSLTGDPVEEIKSAKLILQYPGTSKGRRGGGFLSDLRQNQDRSDRAGQPGGKYGGRLSRLDIKVAVMGCVVNGPGEAKEADIGIAGGIGEGLLIKKGEVIRKVPEGELLECIAL